MVGYCNDGMVIYCMISRDSQKFANIMRDPRVSLAIAKDYPQPLQIKGLSIAARAAVVTDQGESDHAAEILLHRYPEYKVMPRPDPQAVPTMRMTPEIVSVLDYSKGFGTCRSGSRHRQRSRRIHRGAPAPLGGISRGVVRPS